MHRNPMNKSSSNKLAKSNLPAIKKPTIKGNTNNVKNSLIDSFDKKANGSRMTETSLKKDNANQGGHSLNYKKIRLSDSSLRNWLRVHGKEDYIDFDDNERKQYRAIFKALDGDGSGAIGVEELEDPLIALGLAENREGVQNLVNTVDEDGTGEIEFEEFLLIMRSIKKNDGQTDSNLYEFFRDMVKGDFDKMGDMDNDIPFKLNFSQYRRKRILDSIMCPPGEKKDKGSKIMNNFKKQLILKKQQKKIEDGENPNDISLDNPPNNECGINNRTGFPKLSTLMQSANAKSLN